jgi:hypothetical protein
MILSDLIYSLGKRPRDGVNLSLPGDCDHVQECRISGRTMPETGGPMNVESRLESLKTRHASLESRIADEDQRPRPDSDTLLRLKVEKLRLKEEMERLRSATADH